MIQSIVRASTFCNIIFCLFVVQLGFFFEQKDEKNKNMNAMSAFDTYNITAQPKL